MVALTSDEAALAGAATGQEPGRALVARHFPGLGDQAGAQLLHRLGRIGALRFLPS
jgi:hypothetical protein